MVISSINNCYRTWKNSLLQTLSPKPPRPSSEMQGWRGLEGPQDIIEVRRRV